MPTYGTVGKAVVAAEEVCFVVNFLAIARLD